MGALREKTVLFVTHQVDFLAAFDYVLLISEGKILGADKYTHLLYSNQLFQELAKIHTDAAVYPESHVRNLKDTASSEVNLKTSSVSQNACVQQLLKQEERETGGVGFKPYIQYLSESKGFLYISLALLSHLAYILGQLIQGIWLATNLQFYDARKLRLVLVYTAIGFLMSLSLLVRSYSIIILGLETSKSIFTKLISSLFHAPMSFFDSTPFGRILSRISSDLNVVDLDVSFKFSQALATTTTTYFTLAILSTLAWPVIFVTVPMVCLTIVLQKFFYASAKELMRLNGTTTSTVASYLAESIAGAITIRAFGEEERLFSKFLGLVDKNASAYFHSISANEWLILRLEMLATIVVSSSALAMILLPMKASDSGYVGMALSYALSLNVFVVYMVQNQCSLENSVVSVERLEQYMHIHSETHGTADANQAPVAWPSKGEVEIRNLKVRYRVDAPFVLRGINCLFKAGHKIGIVGRTGSGKTTLMNTLFRLTEPTEGRIIIDEVDITKVEIYHLRSMLAIIPQEPVLFSGSIRYNLDPLSKHTDGEIVEVLEKCQLLDVIQTKGGLDSSVTEAGSNWSMGQKQLFCLGRALLRKRKILVLDEATASIDNNTEHILQRTIKSEFSDSTVITVAHRIPSVISCNMVLALRDGEVVEYDEPMKLMTAEGSLFRQLVEEYWSHSIN